MNYLAFKRWALASRIYNILFIQVDDMDVTGTIVVNTIVVDSVPFVVAMSDNTATLTAAIDLFTASPMFLTMTATSSPTVEMVLPTGAYIVYNNEIAFDVEAVLDLFATLDISINVGVEYNIIVEALRASSKVAASTIPVTVTMTADAFSGEIVPREVTYDISVTMTADMFDGTLLGQAVSYEVAVGLSCVVNAASVILTDLYVVGTDATTIGLTIADQLQQITTDLSNTGGMAISIQRRTPRSANLGIDGDVDMTANIVVADMAVIDDWATSTLEAVGSMTLDRLFIDT